MYYYLKNVRKSNINFGRKQSVQHAHIKRDLLRELSSGLGPVYRLGFLMCVGSGYFAQKIGYIVEAASNKVSN